MRLKHPGKESAQTLIVCSLYSLILLFFLSPDSYLHDLFGRADSAWFFTAGKAWMNGMVPYVDFADSKGPLLWLIYGIGYLLNHHSYVGVFWLSVLFYTATLFIACKLCRLYLNNKAAAVATAALPFFLLFPLYHYEVRAEDFCYTFLMLTLYALCRILRDKKTLSAGKFVVLSFAMGVSCAACAMMKWNIAVMMLTLIAVALLYSIKRKCFLLSLGGMAVGFVLIVTPFIIYLLHCGAFDDFIRQYFLTTTATVGVNSSMFSPLSLLQHSFGNLLYIPVFFVAFCGLLLFAWKRERAYWWLPLCFVAFWIALVGVRAPWNYYLSITAPFFIFLVIPLVGLFFNKWPTALRYTKVLCIAIAIITIALEGTVLTIWRFNRVKHLRQDYYRACYVMAQIDKPTILYYGHDYGSGVPVDALPACKYWARQNGMTDEMVEEREAAWNNRVADFFLVYIEKGKGLTNEITKRVEAAGYEFYGITATGTYDGGVCCLYGRPGLELPPDDFYVSNWDVWLKRNLFGI